MIRPPVTSRDPVTSRVSLRSTYVHMVVFSAGSQYAIARVAKMMVDGRSSILTMMRDSDSRTIGGPIGVSAS